MLSHMNVVYDIAKGIRGSLPAQASFEDLIGAGMLGLVDAARKFDPRRRTSFRTYAKHRIQGAIYDELRALDPLSREMRRKHRVADGAVAELTGELERLPTDREIARRLKLTVAAWHGLERQLYEAGFPVNGHGFADKPATFVENLPARRGDPEAWAEGEELRRMLNEAICTLPPRYQKVIVLYHGCEWTMRQIGRELGVNESRVSQMHAWALRRLRTHLARAGIAPLNF
jgi:RNA polymerase sigma factor for flagellar operon FliA